MYCTDVSDMVIKVYKTKFGQRLRRTLVFLEAADYTDGADGPLCGV
jgi:hypothetical protein